MARAAHLGQGDMAFLGHQVANLPHLGIPLCAELTRLSSQIGNPLVNLGFLCQQLARIAFGLLDLTDFLLQRIDVSTGDFGIVLDCEASAWTAPRS